MKILLSLFVLFFSSSVFAENYACQYDYYGESRPVLLKRISSNGYEHFETCSIHFEKCGNGSLEILEESVNMLYLGTRLINEGYQMTIIDKQNLMFRTINLYQPTDTEEISALVEGSCVID